MFKLKSNYSPTWDQPEAIEKIYNNFSNDQNIVTLLGATGTWKTFTMANLIQKIQKPTLIMSHNKTLAAQLATEFKYFFPENAVHYFVSYFDYYQPEAYIPNADMYIEKESSINKEIEMFRLSTMASLLSREDVIVVASVSSLYWLWSKDVFEKNSINIEVWKEYDFEELKKNLINMQYKPVQGKIEPWMFEFRWDVLDVFSSIENILYRIIFDENEVEFIEVKDSTTFKSKGTKQKITIRPATQFLQDMNYLDNIIEKIKAELDEQVKHFKKQWKELEANRLEKRVTYDIKMIQQTGYTNWIENYSMYFDQRSPGQPPNTIFDYFPDDFLYIIDESHMSIPQLQAMPQADFSRKETLVEHWFRLPSAKDHRPLSFKELEATLRWRQDKEAAPWLTQDRFKENAKTLFVSATPSNYEISISCELTEQIIRPTWLLDPYTYLYPKDWNYHNLQKSIENLLKKKPYLEKYLNWYSKDTNLKDIFID